MFLNVKWAKRWLPAIFLLASLFLPWWWSSVFYEQYKVYTPFYSIDLSFLWDEHVDFDIHYSEPANPERSASVNLWVRVSLSRVPILCFVSALVFVSGLCGLSDKIRIRTLGGLLGVAGVISYFLLIFPASINPFASYWFTLKQIRDFPYFGSILIEANSYRVRHLTWFLSAGFYLALAGSLMLLLPLIRTLVERLRKQLRRSYNLRAHKNKM